MASPKTKAAAPVKAAPKAVEDAPPNEIIATMEATAALVEGTLMNAAAGGVGIGLSVFGVTVEINRYSDISMAPSGVHEGTHLLFAAQAGLLLGAARACRTLHETDNGF